MPHRQEEGAVSFVKTSLAPFFVSDLSAAAASGVAELFQTEGEERFGVRDATGTPILEGESLRELAAVIGALTRVISRRVGARGFVMGIGNSPAELSSRLVLHGVEGILDELFTAVDVREAVATIVALERHQGELGRDSLPFLPAQVRRVRAACGGHLSLGLTLRATEVNDAFLAMAQGLGQRQAFWLADDGMMLRFLVREGSITLRARHPVIHSELRELCIRHGVFFW